MPAATSAEPGRQFVAALWPQSIMTRLPLLVVISAQAPCSTSKTSRNMNNPWIGLSPVSALGGLSFYMVCTVPGFNTIPRWGQPFRSTHWP
jgi:hypothetical protein